MHTVIGLANSVVCYSFGFKKSTTSPEDSAFVRDLAEKFRVNNLVEEGPVLKKTRKPNRR